MIAKWKDSHLSLGERCIALAEHELNNGVKEDKIGSYTSARIREYFAICTRLINGKEVNINFVAGNWCAAGASYCLHESLLPGETPPHKYRLGVVEIVSDLQHNNLYRTISQVRNGSYQIKKGDVVIFDRSVPGNPSTAWWRHIGRVYSVGDSGTFKCISGNSGGCWKITDHKLSQSTLLGFGEYPALNTQVVLNINVQSIPDWDGVDILSLVPSEDTGHDLAVDNVVDIFKKVLGP
jgi:hypothetical protein